MKLKVIREENIYITKGEDMSKFKKKLKKAVMAGAALYGASKLMGASGPVGDKFASARKAMTSNTAVRGNAAKPPMLGNMKDKVVTGITKLKRSDLPSKRNMKSIFVGDDGSITKGLEKFKNKEIYSKTMKKRRGEVGSGSLKDFANKFLLGRKTQLNKGKMVKARGGGMAMGGMKPTKLY